MRSQSARGLLGRERSNGRARCWAAGWQRLEVAAAALEERVRGWWREGCAPGLRDGGAWTGAAASLLASLLSRYGRCPSALAGTEARRVCVRGREPLLPLAEARGLLSASCSPQAAAAPGHPTGGSVPAPRPYVSLGPSRPRPGPGRSLPLGLPSSGEGELELPAGLS